VKERRVLSTLIFALIIFNLSRQRSTRLFWFKRDDLNLTLEDLSHLWRSHSYIVPAAVALFGVSYSVAQPNASLISVANDHTAAEWVPETEKILVIGIHYPLKVLRIFTLKITLVYMAVLIRFLKDCEPLKSCYSAHINYLQWPHDFATINY
jgi:hypothetical protein